MRRLRNNSYRAFNHVFGESLIYVIILLISVGWFGDTLLMLYSDWLKSLITPFPSHYLSYFGVLAPSLIILILFYVFAKNRKTSDRYTLNPTDLDRLKKSTLILILSPFDDRTTQNKNEKKSHSEFEKTISNLPKTTSVHDLTKTDFNCNWLPQLHAIEHYENVKEVVVIVTKDTGRGGSFGQTQVFKSFVDKYLSSKNREVTITSHIQSDYITDIDDIKNKNENGAPIDNLKDFGDTVLQIIDNIELKNKNVRDRRKQIAVDVTGGFAWMSAVLAAVTSSQDIFVHYSEITGSEIKSLEIDVSVK